MKALDYPPKSVQGFNVHTKRNSCFLGNVVWINDKGKTAGRLAVLLLYGKPGLTDDGKKYNPFIQKQSTVWRFVFFTSSHHQHGQMAIKYFAIVFVYKDEKREVGALTYPPVIRSRIHTKLSFIITGFMTGLNENCDRFIK